MNIYDLLGKNLKKARKSKKMTQEELAEAVSMSTNYISMLERGIKNPPLQTLEKLARGLDIPLSELVDTPSPDKNIVSKITGLVTTFPPEKQVEIYKALKLLLK